MQRPRHIAAPESSMPLYRQLVDDIKADITNNVYQAGDKIPSESELSATYGVSRVTVRNALKELADGGYLTKRQGRGTFVNQPKIDQKIRMTFDRLAFDGHWTATGYVPHAWTLRCERVTAEPEVLELYGLSEPVDMLLVERLRTADDVPIMIEDSYFYPYESFSAIEGEDMNDASIFDRLARTYGHRPNRYDSCVLEAISATPELAGALSCLEGSPLFFERIRFTDEAGHAMLVGENYIRGDLFAFMV